MFAIDMNGKYMASGGNPRLSGSNALETRDASAKPLFKEMIQLAKEKGGGVVAYTWLNRATNKVEAKRTYIKRSGNTSSVSGIT